MNNKTFDVMAAIAGAPDAPTDAIVPDGDSGEDFRLTSVDGAWVTYRNLSIKLRPTDEGLVADIYPVGGEGGDPIASTYAFFAEAIEAVVGDLEGEVPAGIDDRAIGVLALREQSEACVRAHAAFLDDASRAWVEARLEADEGEEVDA